MGSSRLARGEVSIAGGVGFGPAAVAIQSPVVLGDIVVDHQRRCSVGVQVVDVGVDGEVVIFLDDAEGEAVPFQGVGSCRQHALADLVLLHESEHRGGEFDASGRIDGAPDNVAFVGDVESAVVGVVAAQVGVDSAGHCCDVTPADDGPGRQDQPWGSMSKIPG